MTRGFLGYDTTFMLDFVVCALVVIVPLLLYSLYLVKVRRRYSAHRNLQVFLGIVLLIAVTLFEIDMRLAGGWERIVNPDPDAPRLIGVSYETARMALYIHLVFAVSTPILWVTTIVLALRRMPRPPAPCAHSRLHKTLGWLSTIDITLTSITGLIFYYLAFVK